LNAPYSRFFSTDTGYNPKMHRDDRKNVQTIGWAVHDEVRQSLSVATIANV